MRTSILALGAAALVSAARYPKSYGTLHSARFLPRQEEPAPSPEPSPERCMAREEADHLVDVYAQSITSFSEDLLEMYLSTTFVDISDSINMFIHKPLGAPTFETKEVFIEKQRTGAHFPVDVLSVDAYDCASVALQWVSYFGQAEMPAKGVTVLKTVWEDEMWKMSHIIVEYNALVWLLNMGGSYTWQGKTYTGAEPDATTLPYVYERDGEEPVVPEEPLVEESEESVEDKPAEGKDE